MLVIITMNDQLLHYLQDSLHCTNSLYKKYYSKSMTPTHMMENANLLRYMIKHILIISCNIQFKIK